MDFDQVTVNGVNSNFILFTKYCFVVFLELLDSSVCQRMFCHLLKILCMEQLRCQHQQEHTLLHGLDDERLQQMISVVDSCYFEHLNDLTDQRQVRLWKYHQVFQGTEIHR